MPYEDKASYDSTPPCRSVRIFVYIGAYEFIVEAVDIYLGGGFSSTELL